MTAEDAQKATADAAERFVSAIRGPATRKAVIDREKDLVKAVEQMREARGGT